MKAKGVINDIHKNAPRLKFRPTPDDYGIFNGTFRTSSRIGSVRLLPPSHLWHGKFWREGHEPEADYWIVYVDRTKVFRISLSTDLTQALISLVEDVIDEERTDEISN